MEKQQKLLGNKACVNRLQKYFNEKYGEFENLVQFLPDGIYDSLYIWKFYISKAEKKVFILICCRKTGKVSEV